MSADERNLWSVKAQPVFVSNNCQSNRQQPLKQFLSFYGPSDPKPSCSNRRPSLPRRRIGFTKSLKSLIETCTIVSRGKEAGSRLGSRSDSSTRKWPELKKSTLGSRSFITSAVKVPFQKTKCLSFLLEPGQIRSRWTMQN